MIITLSLLASIDVFKSGADGYNCYRIPSMITLPGGRIFAFAEGRLHDCYDGPNHKIDVVFKSSDDNDAQRDARRRPVRARPAAAVAHGVGRVRDDPVARVRAAE